MSDHFISFLSRLEIIILIIISEFTLGYAFENQYFKQFSNCQASKLDAVFLSSSNIFLLSRKNFTKGVKRLKDNGNRPLTWSRFSWKSPAITITTDNDYVLVSMIVKSKYATVLIFSLPHDCLIQCLFLSQTIECE